MKCVRTFDCSKIRRVDDKAADKLVSTGNWLYCSKEVWRDFLQAQQPATPKTAETSKPAHSQR